MTVFARRVHFCFAVMVGWLCVVFSQTAVPAADRPNILFLFADDQCFETLGALGLTDIHTPHLDRLRTRGTLFSHAYNMGSWSGAVCVASRTMLVTGRSVWDAHRVYQKTDQERQAGVLWPQLMKSAGYRTYMTGKWHVQTDAARVFDVVRDVRGGMPKDTNEGYNRPLADQPDPWNPADPQFGGFWQGGRHWSEVVADHACDFLDEATRHDDPYFMYIAFNAPHDPRQAPQEFLDQYPLDRVQVPSNFLPMYPHKDLIGCSATLRDEKLGPFPRTEFAVQVHRREYYALITHLDAQIGRILDKLETGSASRPTWIFFTADHGLAVGHHGLFGKQNLYEHSTRVPFLVAGPDVPANHNIDAAIYLQDVMPTTLELAGAEPPDHVFFHSLLPFLSGQRRETFYPDVYGAYLELQRSVTADGFKLIAYPRAEILRLYDLNNDPHEMQDLADDPRFSDRKAALFERLSKLQMQLGDDLDLEFLRPR